MRSSVLVSVVGSLLVFFAAPGYGAPKKGKGRTPANNNANIVAPPSSDLTTLDSPESPDSGATTAKPTPGADDPALYDLKSEIPLYKKQTSHESQRFNNDDPFIASYKQSVHVGFSLAQFSYTETGVFGQNQEKGLLPIVHLRYDSAPFEKRWFFGVKGEVNFRGTSYTGQTLNNNAVTGQNHSALMFQGEMWLGARLADLGEYTQLKGYLGLGYRHWSRMQAGDGIDTYAQTYQWMYLPVGFRVQFWSLNDWGLGLDASLRYGFLGRVSYGFAQIDPTLADTNGVLGSSKMNFRISVPVSFKKLIGFPFTIEPWFEQNGWSAGSPAPIVSAVNGAFTGFIGEPESSTKQYGVLFTADFSW